jgi:hypothetical protein
MDKGGVMFALGAIVIAVGVGGVVIGGTVVGVVYRLISK